MKALLHEFIDVFAWDYSDLKGMDPQVYKHKINLKEDAVFVIQQRYRMNPNYAKQVKEEQVRKEDHKEGVEVGWEDEEKQADVHI